MIGSKISDITLETIENLITNKVPEGKFVDYKRELSDGKDSAKKEFLRDVSSFANTDGGFLFYGISEECMLPTGIIGVESDDIDTLLQMFNATIQSGIQPQIQFETKSIHLSNGRYVIIISIQSSWIKPHWVSFLGDHTFYARNSSGKYKMDILELRRMFIYGSIIEDKIEQFAKTRLEEIRKGKTIFVMRSPAKIVVLTIPFDALTAGKHIDVTKITSGPHVPFIRHPIHGLTIHGKVWSGVNIGGISDSYVILYRNSIIETVNTSLFYEYTKLHWSYEQEICLVVQKQIEFLQDIGSIPPYFIYISLLNLHSAVFYSSKYDYNPFTESDIHLPTYSMFSVPDDIPQFLKPGFDIIWHGFNKTQSINFDVNGHWCPRTE